MPDVTLGDWAATGGAVFTALAAGAALWTAWQSRKVIEASERPMVESQVLRDGGGMLRLARVNSGSGLARGVNFEVHAGGRATSNVVGDGFMQPGARVHVVTDIPLPRLSNQIRQDLPDLAAMVAYRDASGFVHYRTHDEREFVPRTAIRRRPKYSARLEAFKRFYPHVDIDAATPASSRTEAA